VSILTYLAWSRRFYRKLGALMPELPPQRRIWTAAHWMADWDSCTPEEAAEVSAQWWKAPAGTKKPWDSQEHP
jgi:hypothetical protein